MDKLLTNKGRGAFSALLMLSVFFVMVGLIPHHMKIPVSEFWKTAGSLTQFVGVFLIIGLGYYAQSRIDSEDLYDALKKQISDDKVMIDGMAALQIKHLSFEEMGFASKIGYVVTAVSALSFFVYAGLDAFGFFPEAKIRAIDGSIQTISRFWMVAMEFLLGVICLLMLRLLFRTQFTDKWEEKFKSFLNEVDDAEKGGRLP